MNLKQIQFAPSRNEEEEEEERKIKISTNQKCLLIVKKGERISRNERCQATNKKFKNCCGSL